jgi:type II secretory pathway predicted ATPase ExeA/pSer/pThr/pTyr-binding forkhead associated (FHA) protein
MPFDPSKQTTGRANSEENNRVAKVTLEVVEGELNTRSFSFTEPTVCLIGRAKDCRIQLLGYTNQQYISRHHCELNIDPPHIQVRDMQSKNGTCVNGRQITDQFVEVTHDDEIALGRTVIFRIKIEPSSLIRGELPTQLQKVPETTQIIASGARPMVRGPWQSVTGGKQNLTAAPTFRVKYFGFRRKPFQGSGLDFLRAYPDYDDTYTYLLDAIQTGQGRLISLIGPAGTGKTLLLRNLVQDPTVGVQAVLCQAPQDYDYLLAVLCEQLNLTVAGAERPHKIGALVNYVKTHHGEQIVVIIDDADDLATKTLNNIFGLFRIGVASSLVLAGSQGLRQTLQALQDEKSRGDDKQGYGSLKETVEIELEPMDPVQVATFIRQQLHIAGGQNDSLFSKQALDRIARCSGGIPGLVNALCDRALLLTEEAKEKQVAAETIDWAANQLGLTKPQGEGADGAPEGIELVDPRLARQTRPSSAQPGSKRKGMGRLIALFTLLLLVGAASYFIYLRSGEMQLPDWLTPWVPEQLKHYGVTPSSPPRQLSSSVPSTANAVRQPTNNATSPAATPPPTTPRASAPVADILRRGQQQLAQGEITAARSAYQEAAEAGNANAMLALGETYDPVVLLERGLATADYADTSKAAEWYMAAFRGGDSGAAERLENLRRWMADAPDLPTIE